MLNRSFGTMVVIAGLSLAINLNIAQASARGAMRYAQQMYQQQYRQEAAMQKAMMEAQQKQAAAEAAEEKRLHDKKVAASRARADKDKARKDEIIAKRKADGAGKTAAALIPAEKTPLATTDKPAATDKPNTAKN